MQLELILNNDRPFNKKEKFEVFIARDGVEALEIVENNKLDIILLDIMMPNVDGIKYLNI